MSLATSRAINGFTFTERIFPYALRDVIYHNINHSVFEPTLVLKDGFCAAVEGVVGGVVLVDVDDGYSQEVYYQLIR